MEARGGNRVSLVWVAAGLPRQQRPALPGSSIITGYGLIVCEEPLAVSYMSHTILQSAGRSVALRERVSRTLLSVVLS